MKTKRRTGLVSVFPLASWLCARFLSVGFELDGGFFVTLWDIALDGALAERGIVQVSIDSRVKALEGNVPQREAQRIVVCALNGC